MNDNIAKNVSKSLPTTLSLKVLCFEGLLNWNKIA